MFLIADFKGEHYVFIYADVEGEMCISCCWKVMVKQAYMLMLRGSFIAPVGILGFLMFWSYDTLSYPLCCVGCFCLHKCQRGRLLMQCVVHHVGLALM